jgi:hypothetical protein
MNTAAHIHGNKQAEVKGVGEAFWEHAQELSTSYRRVTSKCNAARSMSRTFYSALRRSRKGIYCVHPTTLYFSTHCYKYYKVVYYKELMGQNSPQKIST